MALGTQSNQSPSLINVITIGLARDKNFYGAPPVTAARQKAGNSTCHLEHPGAVLCMVDLLPAVGVDEVVASEDCERGKERGEENENEDDGLILQVKPVERDKPVSPVLRPNNQVERVSNLNVTNVHDNMRRSSNEKSKALDKVDVERTDLEKDVTDDECHMTRSEARSVS